MALAREAAAERHLQNCYIRLTQHLPRTFNASPEEELVRRLTLGLLEATDELIAADSSNIGKVLKSNRVCKVSFDVLGEPPQGRAAEAASRRPSRQGAMLSQELGGNRSAKRLGIEGTARVVGEYLVGE